jgi:hypothetical protein
MSRANNKKGNNSTQLTDYNYSFCEETSTIPNEHNSHCNPTTTSLEYALLQQNIMNKENYKLIKRQEKVIYQMARQIKDIHQALISKNVSLKHSIHGISSITENNSSQNSSVQSSDIDAPYVESRVLKQSKFH